MSEQELFWMDEGVGTGIIRISPTPIHNSDCLKCDVLHTKLRYLGLYDRACDDFKNPSFESFRL
jgi:hypothetical protein